MGLTIASTKAETVFTYEEDGMEVKFRLTPEDSEADIMAKLRRLLDFIDREKGQELQRTAAPGWRVMAQGLHRQQDAMPDVVDVTPPQFTGIPPVQPAPPADDLYLAANGWELIKPGEE